jgi:hypothetical protein
MLSTSTTLNGLERKEILWIKKKFLITTMKNRFDSSRSQKADLRLTLHTIPNNNNNNNNLHLTKQRRLYGLHTLLEQRY